MKETIQITWTYQDIQKQADKLGYLLKPSEAKNILSKLEEFYTPEIGMNQEIIGIYIQDHIDFATYFNQQ
jgi:hypothetical protein